MAMRANFLRGQFSLRCLLFVMLLVGIAITIYRRPWEVKTPVPYSQDFTTTTFHRSWTGEAVKHGWERRRHPTGGVSDEVCYDEGEVVCKRHYHPANELFREERLDPATGSSITKAKVELAETLQYEPVKKIIHDDGKKRVREEWRSASGQLLESADWDDGVLTNWNGNHIDGELDQLLADLDVTQRAFWSYANPQQPILIPEVFGDGRIRVGWFNSDITYSESNSPQVDPATSVVMHFDTGPITGERRAAGFDLMFVFYGMGQRGEHPMASPNMLRHVLTEALRDDCTLRARHGLICVAPICNRILSVNRTGIARIQFPAGSTQDAEWNELISLPQNGERTHAERAARIFACTSIRLDVSQLADRKWGCFNFGHFPTPTLHTRRDLFGMFLSFYNYRVEQQGNKLIVLPRNQ